MSGIADAVIKGATSGDTKNSNPVGVAFIRERCSCDRTARAMLAPVKPWPGRAPPMYRRSVAARLLLAGDEDAIAPPSSARAMAQQISGCAGGGVEPLWPLATIERAAE
jgi:hypothetical protein